MRYLPLTAFLFVGLFSGSARSQEEKLFRALTPGQLESTLKGMKIEFKKTADKKDNSYFYDYKTNDLNLRLYFLDGKQLLLDTLFPAMSLEKVNDWNTGPQFCRAGLGKDDKGVSFTVVETRLNLKGGVTEPALKEYLFTFLEELGQFQKFLRDSEPGKDAVKDEKTFTEIAPDLLEKILDELKIKYAKVPLEKGAFAYKYPSKDINLVLTNWGKDMMLEAKFPKISLEKVNEYNVNRKFIRTVAYKNKKGEYSGLETNLNFKGGVTESIVRNFIAVFEEDVQEFNGYVKKGAD